MNKETLLLTILGITIALVIGFFLLPNSSSKEVRRTLAFSRTKIWERIRDIENQTSWRKELVKVEFVDRKKEIWKEQNQFGQEFTFQTTKIEPESFWAMESVNNTDFHTSWTGQLVAVDAKTTELVFRETFEIKTTKGKLIFYLFINLEKLIQKYIDDLESSLKG